MYIKRCFLGISYHPVCHQFNILEFVGHIQTSICRLGWSCLEVDVQLIEAGPGARPSLLWPALRTYLRQLPPGIQITAAPLATGATRFWRWARWVPWMPCKSFYSWKPCISVKTPSLCTWLECVRLLGHCVLQESWEVNAVYI